jgi:hypothetical protein
VTGRIHVDGKSAVGVVLQLVPAPGNPISETRLRPGGVSKADGTFEFTTYSTGDGAPAGDYRLIFFWPPSENEQPDPGKSRHPDSDSWPPDRFQGKYFKAEESDWAVTVVEGPNDIGIIDADPSDE